MKLTDTQLVILSAASQRKDCAIELAPNLKGGTAHKVVGKLLRDGLIEEIQARGSLPVWRRDEDEGPLALRITQRGLTAIQVDGGGARAEAEGPRNIEPGPDLEFNSLDAQREACEAYIKRQAHEGWRLVLDHYDDGGVSGASLDRPALQRLLADVRAGKISIVVVYKVDRLTRSLADFAKLVELFDQFGVSFVSITQSFNTTSSMGRFTLNVLLSFAQFEREVIGERVRDKIAASKRKGIWVGGPVPLGYRCINKKLVVAPEEAETVHTVFTRYLELGSMGALIEVLDRELFEAVQAKLAANAVTRQVRLKGSPAILAGRIFDDRGNRMSPSHSNKLGVRYRYYVSHAILQQRKVEAGSVARVPAAEIEKLVLNGVRKHYALMGNTEDPTAMADRDLIERHVERIIVKPQALEVRLVLASEISVPTEEPSLNDLATDQRPTTATIVTLPWTAPSFAAVKGIIHTSSAKPALKPESRDALLTAIAKSRGWIEDIRLGRTASFAEIAKRESQGERHIRLLTPLAFVSPRIIAAIVDGTAPVDITVTGLARALPYSWTEQEQSIGLFAITIFKGIPTLRP